jgi:AraC-like DNA-binding protein
MKLNAEGSEGTPHISHHVTLSRVSHLVEDLCQNWQNTLSIPVRSGELCIFTGQESRNASHQRISLQEMATAILAAVRSQGVTGARIGISKECGKSEELLRAYHESVSALESAREPVCFFELTAAPPDARPVQSLQPVIKAIQQGEKLNAAVREFLARAKPANGSAEQLQPFRAFLTWAIEHLSIEMISVGADEQEVSTKKEQIIGEILHTTSPFGVCESFRRFTEFLAQQIASAFSQRESKLVLAVSRLVESRGPAGVTIQQIADELHLSAGHLSRVYSRTTGMTLEEYLIRQRVELAKRMLLDPRLNVAEVAERCGFCNPAYFASVFRRYVHCTPREFARQPQVWKPQNAAPHGAWLAQ